MRLSTSAWGLGGGVLALLLVALGWGLTHPSAAQTSRLVGQTAPAMTINTLTGGSVDIASRRGTPLVVNFWASWCVPCRQEAPILNQAAVHYAGAVQFVGVDIQDSDAAARSYQDEFKSPYPVGPGSQPSYLRWGVTAPPETFFVSRLGIIVSRHVGPVDQRALELSIRQLEP